MKNIFVIILVLNTIPNVVFSQKCDWAKSFNGIQTHNQGRDIAVDSENNLYIVGNFRDERIISQQDTLHRITGGYRYDFFFAKFDQAGNLLLKKNAGGGVMDHIATSIAVDEHKYIYITGYFWGYLIIEGDTLLNNTNSQAYGMFLLKFNPQGYPVWAKQFGFFGNFPSINAGNDIVVNQNHEIFVIGGFDGSKIQFDNVTLSNNGHKNMFLVKFNSSGTAIWAKSMGGKWEANGISLDIDPNGYIVTASEVNDYYIILEQDTVFMNNFYDIVLIKFNSSGDRIWLKQLGGAEYECVDKIKSDNNSNYYLSGMFSSDSIMINNTVIKKKDYHTTYFIKLSTTGLVDTSYVYKGMEYSLLGRGNTSIDIDKNNNAYLGCPFPSGNTVVIGHDTIYSDTYGRGVLVIKYDANGNELWGGTSHGPPPTSLVFSFVTGISAFNNGVFIIGGYDVSYYISFGNDSLYHRYLSDDLIDIFFAKYSECISPPTIISQPGVINDCENNKVSLSIKAEGVSPLKYQWYGPHGKINDALGNNYEINKLTLNETGTYYCSVRDDCGIKNSDLIPVSIDSVKTSGIFGPNEVLCSQTCNYYVEGTTGSTYQWYIPTAGELISGQNSNIVTVRWKVEDIDELWVRETNSRGCKGPIVKKEIIINLNGINDEIQTHINIWPNPFNDRIFIKHSQSIKNIKVSILDLLGKLIWTNCMSLKEQAQTEINLPNFSNGVYILLLESESFLMRQKIIKR